MRRRAGLAAMGAAMAATVVMTAASVTAQNLRGKGTCAVGSRGAGFQQTVLASQSFWGCAGWIYAFTLRNGSVVYGLWNGTVSVFVNTQGEVWYAPLSTGPLQYRVYETNYMDRLIDSAAKDIDTFWAGVFARSNQSYYRPQIITYETSMRTPCVIAGPGNSLYCRPNRTIYFHMPFYRAQLARDGNFAPILILAHEWGHHIQELLQIANTYNTKGVELQADCFAGTYAIDADRRGVLDEGDATGAAHNLFLAGDPQMAPWFNPAAHGTGQERIAAFAVGAKDGVRGCLTEIR